MADEKDPKTAPEKEAKPDEAKTENEKIKTKLKISIVLQPREKLFLRIFLIFFTLLVVDLVLVHPIVGYLDRLDETIRIQEEVIPKRLLIWKYKDKILKDYREVKPFTVETSLSQEEEMAQFLRQIEKVSKEANLFVSNINPVKINKKSEAVYELSLDVEGKGKLSDVLRFMQLIEDSSAAIRVSAFNLKPQSKEGEDLKAVFSIVKLGVKKSPLLLSA